MADSRVAAEAREALSRRVRGRGRRRGITLIEMFVLMILLLIGIGFGALGATFFGVLGALVGFALGLVLPFVVVRLLGTLGDLLLPPHPPTEPAGPVGKLLDRLFATRRRILAIWVGFFATAFVLGAFTCDGAEALIRYATTFWGAVLALSVLQAIFVLPVARPRPKAARGKSLVATLLLAAMLAALLLGGIAAAVAHVLQDDVHRESFLFVGLFVFASSWVIWSVLLVRYVLRDKTSSREEILTRLAHQLFAGTVVEALLTIPLDLMIRQRESCYCGTGPFLSYVAGFTVGVIVVGPAMVLPTIMRRHARRYVDHCDECGRELAEFGVGTDFRTNALPMGCGVCRTLLPSVTVTETSEIVATKVSAPKADSFEDPQ